MEYIQRILILILVSVIYIGPAYGMHKLIISIYPNLYALSLGMLTFGLGTFPLGNFLVRWKLNKYTAFVEEAGGVFLYIYTFAVIFWFMYLFASKFSFVYKNRASIFIGYFAIVAIMGIIGYFRAINIRLSSYEIKNKNISKNIKILMFADVHLSQISKKDLVAKIGNIVEKQKPDLILIAGDIIDTDTKLILHDYDKDFQKIKAPMGVYASVGNHEYYGGLDENIKYIKDKGINLLYEEGIETEEFYIVGRSYSFGKRKTIEELTKGNTNNKPVIVIDHSPKESQSFMESKSFLQVSGHTHNGQFFPYNLITKLMFKPDWGIWSENNSHVITTCGVGYWGIPIRFPSFAEVVEINVIKEN